MKKIYYILGIISILNNNVSQIYSDEPDDAKYIIVKQFTLLKNIDLYNKASDEQQKQKKEYLDVIKNVVTDSPKSITGKAFFDFDNATLSKKEIIDILFSQENKISFNAWENLHNILARFGLLPTPSEELKKSKPFTTYVEFMNKIYSLKNTIEKQDTKKIDELLEDIAGLIVANSPLFAQNNSIEIATYLIDAYKKTTYHLVNPFVKIISYILHQIQNTSTKQQIYTMLAHAIDEKNYENLSALYDAQYLLNYGFRNKIVSDSNNQIFNHIIQPIYTKAQGIFENSYPFENLPPTLNANLILSEFLKKYKDITLTPNQQNIVNRLFINALVKEILFYKPGSPLDLILFNISDLIKKDEISNLEKYAIYKILENKIKKFPNEVQLKNYFEQLKNADLAKEPPLTLIKQTQKAVEAIAEKTKQFFIPTLPEEQPKQKESSWWQNLAKRAQQLFRNPLEEQSQADNPTESESVD